MLPGERINSPSNLLEQYTELRTNELNAQRDYLQTEEGKRMVKTLGVEAALMLFPYGRVGKAGFNLLPASAQGGITSLGAKIASRNPLAALRGAPKVKGQGNVKEIFVDKPSYHGTNDPIRFERMGSRGNELGVQVPSPKQSKFGENYGGRTPSFSVASDYKFADKFANRSAGENINARVIPTVLDKKFSNKILDYRNPKHREYIATE